MADPDEGGLAPATVTKNVQVFTKLMGAALEDRLISANPLERLPLPVSNARRCDSSRRPRCRSSRTRSIAAIERAAYMTLDSGRP